MRQAVTVICLLGSLGEVPLSAQESTFGLVSADYLPQAPLRPIADAVLPAQPVAGTREADPAVAAPAWQTAWGVVGLRAIPAGPKMAPNGELYHPNFSLDLNFNFWLWRTQGLYMFADMRLWGETGENGVTNGRDGFLGTSKRQFDLDGGAAWNYAGFWELRPSATRRTTSTAAPIC